MPKDWWNHPRKSPRIPGYDYSTPGYYFVTICLVQHKPILGRIEDDHVILTPLGKIIKQEWLDIPIHYPQTALDEYIIMPDHIHGIIEILPGTRTRRFRNPPVPNEESVLPRHDLTEIVRGFKSWSAKKANEYLGAAGSPFWKRSFYDHVIRTDKALYNIRRYIQLNPQNWSPVSNSPL